MKPTFTANFKLGNETIHYYALEKAGSPDKLARLPFSIKILLENILRFFDGENITQDDVGAILNWDPKKEPDYEIAFTPARVILQDFTGVPCVVDLAAMREAMKIAGGDPKKINPLSPVELVIDHSVMVDFYGDKSSFAKNVSIEFDRNQERYAFLRWGQDAFDNFKVVPPGTGIVHQVNLEFLARVVFKKQQDGKMWAYPDSLVGTDSHTTMINGLGVLGWGVGGIEAEAAMLGQPVSMLIPHVVGVKLVNALPEGATATDLVLTATEMLRKHGVVGKFVEFFGPGLKHLPLADRATIANMAPEYGATCGIFPIDAETIKYMRLSGRSDETIQLVEQYAKAQGMFHDENTVDPEYTTTLTLDLSQVVPCMAGPKRPQDRVPLPQIKQVVQQAVAARTQSKEVDTNKRVGLQNGDVVIAAITSCTNTSNPAVMLAAGLVAEKALKLGLKAKPWVKTSLAPGSQVVTSYLEKAKLMPALNAVGFDLVGYGCTTCIGNSGPLDPEVSSAIKEKDLSVAAVLSGNRNFEGRIHPEVRLAFLASPPLVVAYALAGHTNLDLTKDVLTESPDGKAIYLKDIWPTTQEVQAAIDKAVTSDLFQERYGHVYEGNEEWRALPVPKGERFAWDKDSTYIQYPPYFENFSLTPKAVSSIKSARVLALLGDSVTTDHISPAGNISANSPAGVYLQQKGVQKQDFNSYGARRGNHEVMVRGTFANIRLQNKLLPGTEGGITLHIPSNKEMSIFDASMEYQKEKTPLLILAGKEYGTGSSRDWAAKGTKLLGVSAVIAESFERIHRSNLIGMGVLPLMFSQGESISTLGLTGLEQFDIDFSALKPRGTLKVVAKSPEGSSKTFEVRVAIDTPKELEYFNNGGILPYVLRQLISA